jgi:tetratricopeptide (TPR) repeat protein
VGRRADAVPPTEEAVTLYRDQAAANPAYLPDLAIALDNLGIRYSEVGRDADAVPPAEEAVTLYRDQAAANPAYLPNLAGALDNLGRYRQDAGLSWNADTAWSAALNAMPTPDLKAGLLLEEVRRATPPQAIGDILAALSLAPPPAGAALFSLHAACRELRTSHQDLFDRLWDERLKTGQPPWLVLDDATLTTTAEWLDTPTHAQARDYHRDHADILARPGASTALDELALAGIDPDLIGQYRQLLVNAADQGIEDAYQPLVVEEALSAWLDADFQEQQQLLREDRETLLGSQAAGLLSQWSAEDPDDTMLTFGAALLSLARDGLEPEVFAALDDPGHLNLLLSDLLAAGKPQQLLAAAELVLCLDLDDQALADAQLHLAVALVMTGRADDAPGHARVAARLDPGSVNRWVGLLAQLVPAHPEVTALIQALVTPPDQPDGTSSCDHEADP